MAPHSQHRVQTVADISGYTDFNLKTSILDDVYRRIVGNGLIEKDQMLSVGESVYRKRC